MGKKKRLQQVKKKQQQQHAASSSSSGPRATPSSSHPTVPRLCYAATLYLSNRIKQRNERIRVLNQIRARWIRRRVMKILVQHWCILMGKLLKSFFKCKRVFFIRKVVKWRPLLLL
ncbi:hypothetical protein QQP08_018056 [Theobroma cacao]|nr:hypothetical protein QQP08_018056 [Theobroma cacao]